MNKVVNDGHAVAYDRFIAEWWIVLVMEEAKEEEESPKDAVRGLGEERLFLADKIGRAHV